MPRRAKKTAKKSAAQRTSRKKPQAKRRTPVRRRGKAADAVDALIRAGAEMLALPLEPAWHADVRMNLQTIFAHAARVDGFPLADDSEPAPVFHA